MHEYRGSASEAQELPHIDPEMLRRHATHQIKIINIGWHRTKEGDMERMESIERVGERWAIAELAGHSSLASPVSCGRFFVSGGWLQRCCAWRPLPPPWASNGFRFEVPRHTALSCTYRYRRYRLFSLYTSVQSCA